MAKLYFKFGTMGSSKTAQALMTKFNYEENGKQVLLIKPTVAIRDGTKVKSRIGLESECICLLPTEALYEKVFPQKYGVIIVDEAQFLTCSQVDELREIVDTQDIPVFCYGLRTDFQTHLFEGSKRLFEVADSIEDVKNICKCGRKAIFNARVDKTGNLVTKGESIETEVYRYTPMCSSCYHKELRSEYIANELKAAILDDVDMYNPKLGVYAFRYNEEDAIAFYHLGKAFATSIALKANEINEYWGAILGPGGIIYNNPDEFIDRFGDKAGWITCDEFYETIITGRHQTVFQSHRGHPRKN